LRSWISQEDIVRAAKGHREAAGEINVRRERHDGHAKKVCAAYAAQLMHGLSSKKPTATEGGAYLAVASLLWELFTGEQGVNFERHCRDLVVG
jgi:hypothetical protein